MSNSKQEIISELKNKLKEFKSKFKTQNVDKSPEEENDIMNIDINFDTLKNYYKGTKQTNSNLKETLEQLKNNNIDIDNNNTKNKSPNSFDNNIIESKNTSLNKNNILSDDKINCIKKNSFNAYIKSNNSNNITLINENNENSRKNSPEALDKKYFDFNINNFINKKTKKEISEYSIKKTLGPSEAKIKNTKSYFSFDELSINPNRVKSNLMKYIYDNNNKNNFIKLNLTSKKSISSERNKKFMDNYNTENYKNDNFSETNIFKNDKSHHNYFKQNTKLNDFMSEIKTKNSKKYYNKSFSLTNPIIKNDTSNYNLNFLEKNSNNNKSEINFINIGRKTEYKFYHNNFLNDIVNTNNNNNKQQSFNFMSERKTFSPISRLNNFGNTNTFNNFTSNLSNPSLKTLYNYNSINSNYNYNYTRTFENVKNNNLNYNDINKLKYSIQNLSEDDINKLPMTVYNEIKDLYYLIYIKFFKNK